MDGNILATIGSAIGVLVGVYVIDNRAEDRLTKRIVDPTVTGQGEHKKR